MQVEHVTGVIFIRIHPGFVEESEKNEQNRLSGEKPAGIDEYIAAQPEEIQPVLRKVRETIRAAAPDAVEKISWGMPTFRQGENLIHFFANKNHLGIYPGALESFPNDLTKRLAAYKTSKGAIRFPYDNRLDFDLIADITHWRVSCVKKSGKPAKPGKLRKTLGDINSPSCTALRNLIDTQSKDTIRKWCLGYAADKILPIFEKHCPGDPRPRNAVNAAREYLDGKVKFPDVKNVILNECHAAARELNDNPAAQAAARAVGQGSAVVHTLTHSLGLFFYAAAAVAYDRAGLEAADEVYAAVAEEVCSDYTAALRAVAAENEPDPVKLKWNC